jgi:hypothetical protein
VRRLNFSLSLAHVEKISSWTNAFILVGDWKNFLYTQKCVDAAHNNSKSWGKSHPFKYIEVNEYVRTVRPNALRNRTATVK